MYNFKQTIPAFLYQQIYIFYNSKIISFIYGVYAKKKNQFHIFDPKGNRFQIHFVNSMFLIWKFFVVIVFII